MSSYSGRYQSRLFNFISQQSRKVADQCDRAWRQIKLTAFNALQLGLYPVYVVLQAVRMAGRQLQQATQKSVSQLRSPIDEESLDPVDIPIQRVLSFAEDLLALAPEIPSDDLQPVSLPRETPAARTQTDPLSNFRDLIAHSVKALNRHQPPATSAVLTLPAAPNVSIVSPVQVPNRSLLQGVATLVAQRRLVLVSAENQTLDILTLQQQQQLQQQILGEIGKSGRDRQSLLFHPPADPLVPQGTLMAVFHRFWQMMAWVQTSSIAVKANLFGEAALVRIRETPEAIDRPLLLPDLKTILPPAPPSPSPSLLQFVDGAIAQLEAQHLPEVSKITSSLAIRPPSFLEIAFKSGRLARLDSADRSLGQVAVDTFDRYIHQLIAWLWVLWEYLFGGNSESRQAKQAEAEIYATYLAQHSHLPDSNPSGRDRPDDETWISWDDLFGQPPTLPSAQSPPNPRELDSETAIAPEIAESLPSNSLATSETTDANPPTQSLEAAPDWLETEAVSMGYVKHPLERVLEWLDRAMLWLEEAGLRLWQWAKANLPKIRRRRH